MGVVVTARHMDASQTLQDYATQKGTQLHDDFPRVEHVHVILDVEKRHSISEVIVQAKNHVKVEAKESSENMRTSIDESFEKVDRQLRKLRDKVLDHKAARKKAPEPKQGEEAVE